MGDGDIRRVQIELDEEEYEQFRRFATEQGLSLEVAGYEASGSGSNATAGLPE